MANIKPFLWFQDNAEEAINFYIKIFKNSSLGQVPRTFDGAGEGRLLALTFF